eukprot:jgi/Tetstr1/457197/TSEL_043845.t2
MVATATDLRAALWSLHSSQDADARRRADAFLTAWRATPRSWLQAMELMQEADVWQGAGGGAISFYLSSVLHHGLQRDPQAVEADTAVNCRRALIALLKAVWRLGEGLHSTAVQLCLCIAALVVRDTGLPESSALPALIQTFRESPPHPLASALSLAPLPAGSPDIEWLGPLVELMAVLPEECTAKKIAVRPQRRQTLAAALPASAEPILLWEAAVRSQLPSCQLAVLASLRSWAELGGVPAGLGESDCLLPLLFHAVRGGGERLRCAGAEALIALCPAVKGDVATHRPLLVGMAHLIAECPPTAWRQQHVPVEVQELLTNCLAAAGLSAAAELVASYAGAGAALDEELEAAASAILEASLQALVGGSEAAVLAVLDLWGSGILAAMRELPTPQHVQQGIRRLSAALAAYLKAIVSRSELHGVPTACLTGDARDLPSDIRALRRELGAEIRQVCDLAGADDVLALMSDHLDASLDRWTANGDDWMPLEAVLYACNISAPKSSLTNAHSAAILQKLVDVALALAQGPTPSKLAGTALTLVGGIPTWLERRPEWLGSVLALVLRSLQDPDDTVVRNAASTFQRLAASRPVALALLGDASDAPGRGCGHAWQQLHAWLLHRGGLARRSTVEKELSSEQARRPAPTRAEQCLARMVAASLSSIAAHSPQVQDALRAMEQLVGPSLQAVSSWVAAAGGAQPAEEAVWAAVEGGLRGAFDALSLLLDSALGAETVSGAFRSGAWQLCWRPVEEVSELLPRLRPGARADGLRAGVYRLLSSALRSGDDVTKCGSLARLVSLSELAEDKAPGLECLEEALPQLCAGQSAPLGAHVAAAVRALVLSGLRALHGREHSDPELHTQLFRLGALSARCCPRVLEGEEGAALLGGLLQCALPAFASQHRGVCEAVLLFTDALVAALQPAGPGAAAVAAALGAAPGPGAGAWGPRLVDAYLGAAAGGMPSWMIQPLATSLYGVWRAVGLDVFEAWLGAALEGGTGAPLAWRQLQPPTRRVVALLGTCSDGGGDSGGIGGGIGNGGASADPVVGAGPGQGPHGSAPGACGGAVDLREFKTRLKHLSGGKKKGAAGARPPPRKQ